MTLLGDILGYDNSGNDLMGVNKDSNHNCIVCGKSIFLHTKEEEIICLTNLYGKAGQIKTISPPPV
jgi:hypothetical protein